MPASNSDSEGSRRIRNLVDRINVKAHGALSPSAALSNSSHSDRGSNDLSECFSNNSYFAPERDDALMSTRNIDMDFEIGRSAYPESERRDHSVAFSSARASSNGKSSDDDNSPPTPVMIGTYEVMCTPPNYTSAMRKKQGEMDALDRQNSAKKSPRQSVLGSVLGSPSRHSVHTVAPSVQGSFATINSRRSPQHIARAPHHAHVSDYDDNLTMDLPVPPVASPKLETAARFTAKPATSQPGNMGVPNVTDISKILAITPGKVQASPEPREGKEASRFSRVTFQDTPLMTDDPAVNTVLKTLHARVAELEAERLEWLKTKDEMRDEITRLKGELAERDAPKRYNFTNGFDDNDTSKSRSKLIAERNQLAASVKRLELQLNRNDDGADSMEKHIRTVSEERDSTAEELSVANFSLHQLKTKNAALQEELDKFGAAVQTLRREKEILSDENASHKRALELLKDQVAAEAQKWSKKETTLKGKLSRKEEAVKQLQEMTQELYNLTSGSKGKRSQHAKAAIPGQQAQSAKPEPRCNDIRRTEPTELEFADMLMQGHSRDVTGATMESVRSDKEETGVTDQTGESTAEEMAEIRRLRELLEKHKAAGAEKSTTTLSTVPKPAVIDDTLQSMRSARSDRARNLAQVQQQQTTPRKSSMRDTTGSKARATNANDDTLQSLRSARSADRAARITSGYGQQARKSSMRDVTGNTKPRASFAPDAISPPAVPEMTSAYLLPDITMRSLAVDTAGQPVLSANAQRVLDGIAKHDGANCTVCSRLAGHVASADAHAHPTATKTAHHQAKVPKPVPASDRLHDNGPHTSSSEDGPTLRPSQLPGVALATVIKGLEDELAHGKIELAGVQAAYNKQDSSIDKRRRKAMYDRIQSLLSMIDDKSDQIYALYDVLEGQKMAGQEMQ